jgi:hypothetical protein
MGAARFFKTIVLAGASLTASGCGGTVTTRAHQDDGPSGAVGAAGGQGGASPTDGGRGLAKCADPAQFRCDVYVPAKNCFCDESRAIPSDCERSQLECTCTRYSSDPNAFSGSEDCTPETQYDRAIDCGCNRAAPRVPTDCQGPEQFHCLFWDPVPTSCRCDPSSPTSAESCGPAERLSCHSYMPDVGCDCVSIIIR